MICILLCIDKMIFFFLLRAVKAKKQRVFWLPDQTWAVNLHWCDKPELLLSWRSW